MTSKESSYNNVKRLFKQESLFHISYKDGKPVKEKEPSDLEELQKELNPDADRNPADSIKSALYANQPKAKLKRDRSITARDLNQTLETYIQKRSKTRQCNENDLQVSSIESFDNRYKTYIISGEWTFTHDRDSGILKTTKTPDGALKMEYKSTKLKNPYGLNVNEDFILSKIKEHLNRNKNLKKN